MGERASLGFLVGIAAVWLGATSALANPIYLICDSLSVPGARDLRVYLTLDYSANTVVKANSNGEALADFQGRTVEPIEATEREIVWRAKLAAGDHFTTVHHTLNRMSGDLIISNDSDPSARGAWNCKPGPKPEMPKQKF